jgi:hypothetical protein
VPFLTGLDKCSKSSEDKNILEWFYKESKLPSSFFQNKQNAHIETANRVPGSGKWLLARTEFREWRDGRGKKLWCHGIRE